MPSKSATQLHTARREIASAVCALDKASTLITAAAGAAADDAADAADDDALSVQLTMPEAVHERELEDLRSRVAQVEARLDQPVPPAASD